MKRVILIEPLKNFWEPRKFIRYSSLEPIGIEYVGAVVRRAGYEVMILQQRENSIEELLKRILIYTPEIVGFSVMTYNFDFALDLARRIKLYNSKIYTVFGGYHPSACPEIVADKNIDFVVIGEGERTFVELLDTLNSDGDIIKVRGIAYWDAGLQINEPRERIENLDELPFPLRDKEILKDCKIKGLSYPAPSKQKSVCQITYSRGCPYNCIFCNSSQIWGRQVLWRSPKNLVDEIEHLQREFGTNMFFFTDLTFDLNKMKIYELCTDIRTRRIEINWFAMCRIDHMDNNLLIAMKEAGCSKISYGIDSFNIKTLATIKHSQNVDLAKMKSTIKLTSDLGFIVRIYMIIGYPHIWEDKEHLCEIKEILKTLPIDDLRISFLTPFPGTPLYEEFKREDLLLTEDLSKYSSDEPIVKVKGLPPKELIEERKRIFKEFYNSKEYEMRKKDKLRRFPHLKQSYEEFSEFLYSKKVLR